ncbi:hypothetical protein TUSST3_43250 [Streptomyces sp. TUS-ST3]|nr:hypothetical protein TUSST3_43250 [Streptomyces sp. TUS-ST3]
MQWLPTFDTKLNVWTTAAIIVASIGLYNTVRGWWRHTLGKRAFFVKNLRKLAPHVRHEYAKDLFGEPAWQYKRSIEEYSVVPDTGDFGTVEREMTVRTWPLGRMAYQLIKGCEAPHATLCWAPPCARSGYRITPSRYACTGPYSPAGMSSGIWPSRTHRTSATSRGDAGWAVPDRGRHPT